MRTTTAFTFLAFIFNFVVFGQTCNYFIQPRRVKLTKDLLCPEVMIKDLQELKSKLNEIHPDLYVYTSKGNLDSAYRASIIKVSNELTVFDFAKVISEFLGTIKDSHTGLNPRELLFYGDQKRGTFPFYLRNLNEKFYLDQIWTDSDLIGREILQIDTFNLDDLYNLSYSMSFSEADASSAKKEITTRSMSLIFNIISDLKLTDSVVIKFVSDRDTLFKKVPCSNVGHFLKLKELFEENPVNYFFDSQNRGLLTVLSFEPKNIKNFKKEIDDFFKEVNLRNCNDIVVDLRDNHGGYVRAQEYLLSYLNYKKLNHEIEYVYKRSDYDRFSLLPFYQKWQFKQRAKKVYPNGVLSKEFDFYNSKNGSVKKIIYDYLPKNDLNKTYCGKCTLLMNGFSMSASVLFAGWFKSSERGEIIGSPCLGTMSGTFGNSAQIRLSETGLPIIIATLKFNPQHTKNIQFHAIEPDKNIFYSVEDIKLRRDPVFQYLNLGSKTRIN